MSYIAKQHPNTIYWRKICVVLSHLVFIVVCLFSCLFFSMQHEVTKTDGLIHMSVTFQTVGWKASILLKVVSQDSSESLVFGFMILSTEKEGKP